jgi:hypothetical protein
MQFEIKWSDAFHHQQKGPDLSSTGASSNQAIWQPWSFSIPEQKCSDTQKIEFALNGAIGIDELQREWGPFPDMEWQSGSKCEGVSLA